MQIPYAKILSFDKTNKVMTPRASLVCMLAILLASLSSASPARQGRMVLTQPDGSTFSAIMQGDEFTRIKTTTDGAAIIQESDGWWCYAVYDDDGTKRSSGHHIGKDVPEAVISASRLIPRTRISEIAKARRKTSHLSSSQPVLPQLKSSTTRHGIIILAQFQDIRFKHSRQDFIDLLMSDGYHRHGATGSAKEYFNDQFKGRLDFCFDVSDIVTLPARREYYGGNDNSGNDSRPAEMVRRACEAAWETGVDFSIYDENEDGFVDNVFVFFAGEDEAEGADENSIWSHAWYLYHGAGISLELNGKLIDRYACSSEITRIYDKVTGKLQTTRLCGIGTFCHEYCHTFGLPDLYDTDYDEYGGWAAGLWGSTSIMDSGNRNNEGNTPPNFNAIEREILGLDVPIIIEDDGQYNLDPIEQSGKYYKIGKEDDTEYYILECRSDTKDIWDRHIGGSGMLVYHIDKSRSESDRWTTHNTVNADASHQCADLIEADGRPDSHSDYLDFLTRRKNIEGIFFPCGHTDYLTSVSSPGLTFWNNSSSDISITGIKKDNDGNISFNVIGFSEGSTPPRVKGNIEYETFPDAAIIRFESSRPHTGEAVVLYGHPDSEMKEILVHPYKEGKYSVMLEGLDPVRTYSVNISFTLGEVQGEAAEISFMTKKKPVVTWPFMSFGNNAKRNNNGTFLYNSRIPLKVSNCSDVQEIEWLFNGRKIEHDGDHYYTLSESGTLEARLHMQDGSTLVLVKTITLSAMTVQ